VHCDCLSPLIHQHAALQSITKAPASFAFTPAGWLRGAREFEPDVRGGRIVVRIARAVGAV
jgi:hypothetical protein